MVSTAGSMGTIRSSGTSVAGLECAVVQLDERLSRVEKRLDDLAAAEPRDVLRAEVQDLRTRIETLQARMDSLEGRVDGGPDR
jgi:hypothetical protein